jgi:O-antigen ligase
VIQLKSLLFVLIPLAVAASIFISSVIDSKMKQRVVVWTLAVFVNHFIAFLSPNVWVLFGAAIFVIPVFARQRYDVAPLYIASVLLAPGVFVPLHIAGMDFSTLHLSLSYTLGATLALLLTARGGRLSFTDVLPAILLSLVLFAASARDANMTTIMRTLVTVFFTCLWPALVLARAMQDRQSLISTLIALGMSCTLLAGIALFEAVKFWPIYQDIMQRLNPATYGFNMKLRNGFMRSVGPFPESTSFGFFLALGTVALLASFGALRRPFLSPVLLPLSLLALASTMSRGPIVVAVIGLAIYAISRKAPRLAPVALAASAFFAALPFFAPYARELPVLGRFLGSSADAAGTVDYRHQLARRGIEEVLEAPLLGRPLATVYGNLRDLTQGEGIVDFVNTYLFYALTTGLVGLFVLLTCFVIPAVRLQKGGHKRSSKDQGLERMRAFALAGLGGFLVQFAVSSFVERQIWIFVFLLVFAGRVAALRSVRVHTPKIIVGVHPATSSPESARPA